MTDRHNTTIELDEDKDGYVLDCTCPDRPATTHDTYNAAFRSGYDHWETEVK